MQGIDWDRSILREDIEWGMTETNDLLSKILKILAKLNEKPDKPGTGTPEQLKRFDEATRKPDKRDPDTKEDYLLKMDREAREEKRKRLGEFKPDKPRIEVGQLGKFWDDSDDKGAYIEKYIGVLHSICDHPTHKYHAENDAVFENFKPCTHAEIMEFAKKAPK